MKTYEIFTGEELKIADLILRRRLQILIHSCIYYELNKSLISDKQWDSWARELVQLQKDYPNIAKQIDWSNAFDGFDASTGAFLPIRDSWVMRKAQQLCGEKIQDTVIKKPVIKSAKKRKLF